MSENNENLLTVAWWVILNSSDLFHVVVTDALLSDLLLLAHLKKELLVPVFLKPTVHPIF